MFEKVFQVGEGGGLRDLRTHLKLKLKEMSVC